MSQDSYEINGRTVTMPVRIRDARQWSAQFLVPAAAAQRVVRPTGLQVAQPLPGRALVALAFVDYLDGDLDQYHELAVTVMVRPHDAPPAQGAGALAREFFTGRIGAYIHDLPVDAEFTRAAGTGIWGYPKWIATLDFVPQRRATACVLSTEEGHQLTLEVADSGPFTLPAQRPPTYSWRDGVLRRTAWDVDTAGGGARLGGASLVVGAEGPVADELRSLGLPRRALMASATPHLRCTFGSAEIVQVRPDP